MTTQNVINSIDSKKHFIGIGIVIIYIIMIISILSIKNFQPYINNIPNISLIFILVTFSLGGLFAITKTLFGNNYTTNEKILTTIGQSLLLIIGIVIVILLLIFALRYPLVESVISISSYIFIIGSIILGLSLLYKEFKFTNNKYINSIKNQPFLGLLFNLIFYLPCLIIDIIDFVKYQYNITTKTTLIIFILEVILVVLYYITPILKRLYIEYFDKNTTHLLIDPIYLNKETTLGNFQNHQANLKTTESEIFTYNYAVNLKIWINPQPPSTSNAYSKNTNIFNYGNKILISHDDNKIYFTALTNKTELITLYILEKIPYQKWINIIINYNGGTLDLFLDGKLISSEINIVPYMSNDLVIVGENNGIHGGIKNILYYNNVLDLNKIKDLSN